MERQPIPERLKCPVNDGQGIALRLAEVSGAVAERLSLK
jgi:hypothetical protein